MKSFINKYSGLIWRVTTSLIFILAGFKHIFKSELLVSRLLTAPGWSFLEPFFNPNFLILSTGVLLFLGGVALLFNYKTNWVALFLLTILIPITLTVQVGSIKSLGPLLKNIAIMGSLIHMWTVSTKTTKESV